MRPSRPRRESRPIGTTVARQRRLALNWSQAHVAALAMVPQPYVSRAERGELVYVDAVIAISKVLGVEPEDLMKEVEV